MVTEIIRREKNESDSGGMRVQAALITIAQASNTRTFCRYFYANHALSNTMAF